MAKNRLNRFLGHAEAVQVGRQSPGEKRATHAMQSGLDRVETGARLYGAQSGARRIPGTIAMKGL